MIITEAYSMKFSVLEATMDSIVSLTANAALLNKISAKRILPLSENEITTEIIAGFKRNRNLFLIILEMVFLAAA